ncbi:hypothetical protein RQP46_005848 [Phenoliferia psychrophenolica]
MHFSTIMLASLAVVLTTPASAQVRYLRPSLPFVSDISAVEPIATGSPSSVSHINIYAATTAAAILTDSPNDTVSVKDVFIAGILGGLVSGLSLAAITLVAFFILYRRIGNNTAPFNNSLNVQNHDQEKGAFSGHGGFAKDGHAASAFTGKERPFSFTGTPPPTYRG